MPNQHLYPEWGPVICPGMLNENTRVLSLHLPSTPCLLATPSVVNMHIPRSLIGKRETNKRNVSLLGRIVWILCCPFGLTRLTLPRILFLESTQNDKTTKQWKRIGTISPQQHKFKRLSKWFCIFCNCRFVCWTHETQNSERKRVLWLVSGQQVLLLVLVEKTVKSQPCARNWFSSVFAQQLGQLLSNFWVLKKHLIHL